MTNALVQTVETFHTVHCGPVTYLKVYTPDYSLYRDTYQLLTKEQT